MRIGILTTHLPPVMGGIEVHCENLALALHRGGHDVVLFGSLERGQDAGMRIEHREDGLLVRRIPALFAPGLKRPSRLVALGRAVRQEHSRAPFTLLHAHQIFPVAVAGALFSRALGIPLVVTEHGSILDDSRDVRKRPLIRWAARRAAVVLTASRELAEAAVAGGVPPSKAESLPNAIWPEQFDGGPDRTEARRLLSVDPDRFVVCGVRRLVPKTGMQYAIRAVAECRRSLPGILLIVVGGGPMHGELVALARNLGIEDHVRFAGPVDNRDVAIYMRGADVGVFPSLAEATSIAALEFMASGTPIVASSVGGLPEIVDDGRTGFLFDIGFQRSRYTDPGLPAASVRNLAEALERAEKADLVGMGRLAAEVVRSRFSWPAYVARLESEYYRRAIGQPEADR